MMETEPIKTFVFVDLESTGLPGNTMGKKVRITELCFVSVSRENILNCSTTDLVPRIKQKLSFCVNPNVLIEDDTVDLAGICNFMVEAEKPFNDNHVLLIKHFLKNLSEPVCLIAHNGFGFDFRLLKAELNNFEAVIPDNVLCADSLLAVRCLSNAPENGDRLNAVLSNTDLMLYEATEQIETEFEEKNILEECLKIERQFCSSTAQTANETTPVAQIISTSGIPSTSSVDVGNVKRKLFDKNLPRKKLKLKYGLSDIYKSFFNTGVSKAHEAESDALALLKCCVKIGEPILNYFDDNSKLFTDIKSF